MFVSKLFIVLFTYSSIIFSIIIAMSIACIRAGVYVFACVSIWVGGVCMSVCVCICTSIYYIFISKHFIFEALDYIYLYTDS